MASAWLMIAAGDDRQHAGNEGYDDDPAKHYSWDDTVANHEHPQPGHIIALWDKKHLIGAGVIERIEESDTTKKRLRCPQCSKTNIKERKQKRPKYRCHRGECGFEFNDPVREPIQIHTYRSHHTPAWIDMAGTLDGKTLRQLCKKPKSQQSIRELDWNKLLNAISNPDADSLSRLTTATQSWLTGGHRNATVRVRVGQRDFRRQMLEKFGSTCAFTGHVPDNALDAAHLYSFADVGRHEEHGGMLLRKDLHRLFDLGLLAVNPATKLIDVNNSLEEYSLYYSLHGQPLQVQLNKKELAWLTKHWQLHRTD